MRLRALTVTAACLSIAVGMLAGTPAEARSGQLTISTKTVVISGPGNGKVKATCHSKRPCKGKIFLVGGPKKVRVPTAYSVPGKSKKWIKLRVSRADAQHPWHDNNGRARNKRSAVLRIKEKQPKKVTRDQTIRTERRQATQRITGQVRGSGPTPRDVKVTLWTDGKNRRVGTQQKRQQAVGSSGKFSFDVPLGRNNTRSKKYQLSVSARDAEGQNRTWFWRGRNGVARGGGKYIGEASTIVVKKSGQFVADFTYGSISGYVRRASNQAPISGASVTVVAPPKKMPKGRIKLRELDIDGCANVFGKATVNGSGFYQVGFLPANFMRQDRRYFVYAESQRAKLMDLWAGNTKADPTGGKYGTCQHAAGYKRSTAHAISLNSPTSPTVRNISLRKARGSVLVKAKYRGFKPTKLNDRHVSLRQYEVGKNILASPVVATGTASAKGKFVFDGVAPGKYWVEMGRRTSCSEWYASRFSQNNAYFKGRDRGSEKWKIVSGRHAQRKKSIKNGFPKSGRKLPKGRKGWMYRNHCKAEGTGAQRLITVRDAPRTSADKVKLKISKGAVITGRVTRPKNKTTKEMLVSVYSTRGKLVMRTDLTDGSGRFEIRGLAPGNYRIGVNRDSWRGITRSFTGTHTKRVKAGKRYSVGTLHLKG